MRIKWLCGPAHENLGPAERVAPPSRGQTWQVPCAVGVTRAGADSADDSDLLRRDDEPTKATAEMGREGGGCGDHVRVPFDAGLLFSFPYGCQLSGCCLSPPRPAAEARRASVGPSGSHVISSRFTGERCGRGGKQQRLGHDHVRASYPRRNTSKPPNKKKSLRMISAVSKREA
ncbi:hypothetical protein B296_00046031 [Ensete ventricosum]|uniref:Uncharacterized protein n=1 Tax=Ensete ventricosum TaxID=4639 RepID=A0A426XM08_ENSVE|nr:hypothetical protein B296_00046031 [Ensete ventricosum]